MSLFREYLTPEVLQHFGLPDDPFDDPESPEDIWRGGRIKFIEKVLWKGLMRRRIIALVAPPGGGKTKLVRRLNALAKTQEQVRLIYPSSLDRRRISVNGLAVAILLELTGRDTSNMGQEARSKLLLDTLRERGRADEVPCLLIDEAHDLSDTALIAIKRIWDSQLQFRELSVILVGQPPLLARLRGEQQLRELALRTTPIEVGELGQHCGSYLRWRFSRVADADGNVGNADRVFTEGAIEFIAGKGRTPASINNLCVAAMTQAHRIGEERVTAEIVHKL